MEIVGGFMVMMSIISLFLAVVWLIMPFVVFAIKGKQDRTLEVLETIESRLAVLEARLQTVEPGRNKADAAAHGETSDGSLDAEQQDKKIATRTESAADKNGSDVSSAV